MKRFYKLLLLAFLAFLASSASAYDFMKDGIAYNINSDRKSVTVTTGGSLKSGPLTIPSFVTNNGTTYEVTIIGSDAFSRCTGLTGSLTIPNTVKEIGLAAFRGCSGFTGPLVLSSSLTSISENAFYGCTGFTGTLDIPSTVTFIGRHAFYACRGFDGSLIIPNSVKRILYEAFKGCSGIKELFYNAENADNEGYALQLNSANFERLVIGDGVKRIPGSIFRGLTGSLTMGNSVEFIGRYAFADCSFGGSLKLPDTLTEISDYAFSNCSGFTGSLAIPDAVTIIGKSAFAGCTGLEGALTLGCALMSIGESAFSGCSALSGSLVIPDSTTDIGKNAFNGCSGFTGSLTIGNAVATIGDRAFSDCVGLTGSLVIGNAVKRIGEYAFYGCSGFNESLVIPNSVTSIDRYAFAGCDALREVYFNAENCDDFLHASCFWQNSNVKKVVIGSKVKRIPANFAYGSDFGGSLTMGNSVTSIGDRAFAECTRLTGRLVLPSGITSIGEYTFYKCSGFTGSLTIPGGVTDIGHYAFYRCSGFTGSLIIPDAVKTVGIQAFYECSGFSGTITIGRSVTVLRDNALGVTPTSAFSSTSSKITKIVSRITNPQSVGMGSQVFSGIPTSTCRLIVPPGTIDAYKNGSYNWSDFLLISEYDQGEIEVERRFLKGFGTSFAGEPIGVTADGASQLILDLGVDVPHIASISVATMVDGQFIADERVVGTFGTAKHLSNGHWEIEYCAPREFIGSTNEFGVDVCVSMSDTKGNWWEGKSQIIVMRPGVLLLHGLMSDLDCFEGLESYLTSECHYRTSQIHNGAYYAYHGESFESNTHRRQVVFNGMKMIYNKLQEEGIISSRFDLIGHSMGGILARKYAQEVNPGDVNRIITLDTPHSGSQLANVRGPLSSVIELLIPKLKGLYDFTQGDSKYGAIGDLETTSDAIKKLNDAALMEKAKGIPVHAICSYMLPADETVNIFGFHPVSFTSIACSQFYGLLLDDGGDGYDLLQKIFNGNNDGVVSSASQLGGLHGKCVTYEASPYKEPFGFNSYAHHCSTNKWETTYSNINKILNSSIDEAYSVTGFQPLDLGRVQSRLPSPKTILKAISDTSFIHVDVNRVEATRLVDVNTTFSGDVEKFLVFCFTNEDKVIVCNRSQGQLLIPETFEGDLTIYALGRTADGSFVVDEAVITGFSCVASLSDLYFLEDDDLQLFLGQSLTMNVVGKWDNGETDYVPARLTASTQGILQIDGMNITAIGTGQCVLTAEYKDQIRSLKVRALSMRGDVNADGVVDVDDLNIVINIMVRKASMTDWPAADLDSNSVVDIDDLNRVINIMVHKE